MHLGCPLLPPCLPLRLLRKPPSASAHPAKAPSRPFLEPYRFLHCIICTYLLTYFSYWNVLSLRAVSPSDSAFGLPKQNNSGPRHMAPHTRRMNARRNDQDGTLLITASTSLRPTRGQALLRVPAGNTLTHCILVWIALG